MATGGQFYWPSVGTFVAAYGQFFMAAYIPARRFAQRRRTVERPRFAECGGPGKIYLNGGIVDKVQVDDVMTDGSVLWLRNGRRIIENLPGTFIRLTRLS
ncbi:hypothetical protein NicSoilE8_41840 (plasmid) [Arthrobacter sp. NicSoilE8]|nr:hypothetical protein NicSoilE8_41840 [Arthrobacter sp. NicSoilE8]